MECAETTYHNNPSDYFMAPNGDSDVLSDVLREGVFTACNTVMDPTLLYFIDDCVFDFALCNTADQETCYCSSLATYAAACAAADMMSPNWRRLYCHKRMGSTYIHNVHVRT